MNKMGLTSPVQEHQDEIETLKGELARSQKKAIKSVSSELWKDGY
jgi:hypothetical protein